MSPTVHMHEPDPGIVLELFASVPAELLIRFAAEDLGTQQH